MLLGLLLGVPAQGAAPEVVAREGGLRTIDTVELFRNGVYWWTSSACSETANPGGAGGLAYSDSRLISSAASRYRSIRGSAGGFQPGDVFDPGLPITDRVAGLRGFLAPGCEYGAHFVRDDDAFYYAEARTLRRKPVSALGVGTGEPITFLVGIRRFPVTADGVLYATDTELWSYVADRGANTLTVQRTRKRGTTDVHEIMTLPGLALRKFGLADVWALDGSHSGTESILLTPDGRLYRAGVTGENLRLIRTGVSDFAWRDEVYTVRREAGFEEKRRATTLYVAVGNPLTLEGGSRVLALDLTPGGRGEFLEYAPGPGYRVASVAVDRQHIFVTRTLADGGAGSELMRRRAPAEPSLVDLGDPEYVPVGAGYEFRSLRSSGRQVYFAHENTVRRLPVDAAPMLFDFEAFAVEATQAIQDLNNTVPLVAGKRVFVRGYARLAANSTAQAGFDVPALLRVLHAPATGLGQAPFTEVPGSPFQAVHSPMVGPVEALAAVRTNGAATYLFEVPESLVTPGRLQFEFLLNPGRTVPETASNPLANNTATATLDAHQTIRPGLMMVTVKHGSGFYDPASADSAFWDILARARTLLPIPGFRLGFRTVPVVNSTRSPSGFEGPGFEFPADRDRALDAVDAVRIIDGNPLGGPYVGMVPPAATNFGGIGRRPGQAMVVRMSGEWRGDSAWGAFVGGGTLAHEFGHNTGLKHVRSDLTCGSEIPEGPWDSLPNGASPCTLGAINLGDPATAVGFDPLSRAVIPPDRAGDLMSYATNRWISEFNWRRMLDVYTVRAASRGTVAEPALHDLEPGSRLIVLGWVDPATHSGDLLPAYTLPGTAIAPGILAELTELPAGFPSNHPVRLQLLDQAGQVLVDAPAPLQEGSEGPIALVSRALPVTATARLLRLVDGGRTLAERQITPSAPTLHLGSPLVEGDTLSLAWVAADADGDPLRFTTQFSADGERWQTLGLNQDAPRISVNTAALPGGDAARVRVLATDGIHTTLATSAPFPLSRRAPEVHITGLEEGAQRDFGTVPDAAGFGYDAEDGSLPDAALQWTLVGPENRQGIGATPPLAALAPGEYSLVLRGSDSDGLIGSRTVRFGVRALAPSDGGAGSAPVLDGWCADVAYGLTPALLLDRPDGGTSRVRFARADGALFLSFSGLRYGGGNGASGAVAGLRIDVGGTQQAVATTVGFAVNEHGETLRLGGDGTRLLTLTNPPPGFRVVIVRDEQSWGAEMRIEGDLLGDWNQRLGWVVFSDDGEPATPPNTWPPRADLENPASWAAVEPRADAPQGRRLYYARRVDDRVARICSARPDGSDEAFVTEGARPEVSPDGRFLAFVRGGDYATWLDNDLLVRDLNTGVETAIGSNAFEHLLLYDWTADSRVLYADYANTLYRANRDGTGVTALPFVHESDDAPALSPVDGRLAFHHPDGLFLERPDRSQRARVPNTPAGARWPEWSPDGEWLSYTDGTNVWKIRPDGTNRTRLSFLPASGELRGFTSPWTPDGQAVLTVAAVDGVQGIYALAADGAGGFTRLPLPEGLPINWVSRRPPVLPLVWTVAIRIVETLMTADGLSVNCQGPAGLRFQLERTDSLDADGLRWRAVGEPVVHVGMRSLLRDTGAARESHGFYRVRVVPTP